MLLATCWLPADPPISVCPAPISCASVLAAPAVPVVLAGLPVLPVPVPATMPDAVGLLPWLNRAPLPAELVPAAAVTTVPAGVPGVPDAATQGVCTALLVWGVGVGTPVVPLLLLLRLGVGVEVVTVGVGVEVVTVPFALTCERKAGRALQPGGMSRAEYKC